MRIFLTTALIIWPSLAYAQIGGPPTKSDDLVTSSRLGKLAKKLSDEKAPTANPLPNQGRSGLQNSQSTKKIWNENIQTGNQLPPHAEQLQRLLRGETTFENSQLSPTITNPEPSLSGMKVTSGAYDLSAGQDTSLDIAGVTIGMSPDQVKHILAAKGYVLEETKKGPSFDELVKIKRENIQYTERLSLKGAIARLEFKKGDFETISVHFMSMLGHPITRSLRYSNKDTSLTDDKIRHLFRDKYGSDHKAKRELKRKAGLIRIEPQIKQNYLDNQKYFEWFNRDDVDYNRPTRLLNRRIQQLDGTIGNWKSSNNSHTTRFRLTLDAEKDLETLQEEQIRSRFGAATTTF